MCAPLTLWRKEQSLLLGTEGPPKPGNSCFMSFSQIKATGLWSTSSFHSHWVLWERCLLGQTKLFAVKCTSTSLFSFLLKIRTGILRAHKTLHQARQVSLCSLYFLATYDICHLIKHFINLVLDCILSVHIKIKTKKMSTTIIMMNLRILRNKCF